jgi:hypothetical protein
MSVSIREIIPDKIINIKPPTFLIV